MPTIKNIITICITSLVLLNIIVNANQTQQLKLVRLDGSEVNSSSSQVGLANVSWEEANKNKKNAQPSTPLIPSATTESSSSVVVSSNPTNSDSNSSINCQIAQEVNGFNAQWQIDRQNKLLSAMTSRGWSCTASVYMLGSILTETSLNITQVGYDGLGSVGIKQWHSGRKNALMRHCNPWGDLDCQVDFMFKEMSEYTCVTVMTQDNSEQIKSCIKSYTRWGVLGRRWKFAQNILNNLK